MSRKKPRTASREVTSRSIGGNTREHPGTPGNTAARPTQAAELLALVHAVGAQHRAAPEAAWNGERWGSEVAGLARRAAQAPERMIVVDSHRDLDPNDSLLRASDGTLASREFDGWLGLLRAG